MRKSGVTTPAAVAAMLLVLAGQTGLSRAGEGAPMTPEAAAKLETVRQQAAQRVTGEKRRAAAEALKAERIKVHQAQQEQKQAGKQDTDQKQAK